MDSFQDNGWDPLDYNNIMQDNLCWSNQSFGGEINPSFAGSLSQENASARKSFGGEINPSFAGSLSQENASARKRARNESCSGPSSKACREKMRRDKMNDRFSDLCSILEPGRPVKTDKSAILSDAIRVLNQLRTEAKDLKEANEKLQEDIKVLKAEKNELREEKLHLKADKERMEQQVKAMTVLPVGFVPQHPVVYPAGVNKMVPLHGYGGVPMWQFLSPASFDTSQDTVLRPPAA